MPYLGALLLVGLAVLSNFLVLAAPVTEPKSTDPKFGPEHRDGFDGTALDEKSWFGDLWSSVSNGLEEAGKTIDDFARKTATAWIEISEKYEKKLEESGSDSLGGSASYPANDTPSSAANEDPEDAGSSGESAENDSLNSVSQKTADTSDEYADTDSEDASGDD